MEIAELKTKLDQLLLAERRRLTAYLVARDRMLDPEFSRELTRRIEDTCPERWLTVEEAEKRLNR